LRFRRGPHLPHGDVGKPSSLLSLSGCMEATAKERTTGIGAGTSMGGGAAGVVEDDAAVEEENVGVEDDAAQASGVVEWACDASWVHE